MLANLLAFIGAMVLMVVVAWLVERLVLGKLGEQNGITITSDEVNHAITARARQYPGQEQQVFQYYAQNPQAQAEIRAPLFEDKVVDFIAELAQVTEKKVAKDVLFADPEDEAV